MSYVCRTCGKTHDDLPDLGFQYPDHYFDVPEDERDSRIKCDTDLCSLDNEFFFIRGVILIPIKDTEESFGIGVWVSQKEENFNKYIENPDTDKIGPFFGWLCNSIPFYEEETQSIKTMAHFQGNEKRPLIEIEPSDHKLYKDWSEGITIDEAWDMAHVVYSGD